MSLNLYRKLYLIRRAEEFIVKHYPEDEMKSPMHMSMGQEAVSAGVCQALGSEGQIFSSYRSHAAFLAKTEDTDKFFGELYGKVTGTARGKAGSMHLADPERGHLLSSAVVATSIPVAVGAAYANQQQKTSRISSVFFGDGALEEGVFWESLNYAGLKKLPVLFVCEDNGLAVHTPKSVRQGFQSIARIVSQFGWNVFEEETTDVELIYELAGKAIQSIRSSGKPSFLLLKCYRYLEHVGIQEDFEAGYRPRSEFEEWRKRDSVALQRKKLLDSGYSEGDLAGIERGIERQIEESIRKAKAAPFAGAGELGRGVFHEKD